MAIEMLCIKLQNYKTVPPFKIEQVLALLSMFADDMSIFFEYDDVNLLNAVRILSNFFDISGLNIQVEKTLFIDLSLSFFLNLLVSIYALVMGTQEIDRLVDR